MNWDRGNAGQRANYLMTGYANFRFAKLYDMLPALAAGDGKVPNTSGQKEALPAARSSAKSGLDCGTDQAAAMFH
jgi:hypothetical protein